MNDKIKMGVVGLRFGDAVISGQIIQGIGHPYVQLCGVTDLNAAVARSRSERYNVPHFATYDDMLADKSIEAVGIFTPPAGRADMVRRAILARKHVMTTKPFELDAGAALSVLNEARNIKRVVHMNSPSPLLPPDWQQVETWRRRYKLGRPIAANFSTWASYREEADGSWMDDPKRCPAAPIFRIGIYSVNDMVRLMGPAASVQVTTSRLFTGRPTPDNAQLTLRFKNGAIGGIFASFCINDGNFYADAVIVNFENGTIYINAQPPVGPSDHIQLHLVMAEGKAAHTMDRVTIPLAQRAGTYQWDNFYHALREGTSQDTLTPLQVAEGIAIVEAMYRAEASGMAEAVADPEQLAMASAVA